MLGPPLPPSSSHLPLLSSAVLNESPPPPYPYPLTLPQTSPSTRDDWSSTCDLSMRNFLPKKTATIVDVQTPYYTPPPCSLALFHTHIVSLEKGGGGGDSMVSFSGLNTHMCPQKADCFPSNNHPTSCPLCSPFSGSNQALLHISCHKLCRRNVDLT